jgi:predicted transcriptional regulator
MYAVILIMALAGAAGGIANWILNSGVESEPSATAGEPGRASTIQLGIMGYVLVGIVASFTVPLFLSLAQSTLLANAVKADAFADKLVFAGFCIIAAFSSRAFMRSVSAALIKEVREVGEKASQAKATAAEAKTAAGKTEERVEEIADNVSPAAGIGDAPVPEAALEAPDVSPFDIDLLSSDEKRVLHAASRMSLRTLQGIVRDSGVSQDRISEIIDGLIAKGLLERTRSQNTGNLRYRLTTKGVATTNRLLHPD